MIIPSIDLYEGQCVRLKQGDFEQMTYYPTPVTELAAQFQTSGAEVLHIVDLQGAKDGEISQLSTIAAIRDHFDGVLQVGGGIRSAKHIEALLKLGVDRAVIGSMIVTDPTLTRSLLQDYGNDAIVFALDFKMKDDKACLAIRGWQEDTDLSIEAIIEHYSEIKHVLCTDINKDGMQQGPNHDFYHRLHVQYPHLAIQASGGVTSIADLKMLKTLGIQGAIIGKALHEQQLDLKDALACLK
jgi:phosphoribosylformimino-5-aminoimidazole carboxamide ribotide isomerase